MKLVLLCPRSFGANTYLLISGSSALVVDPCVTVEAIRRSLEESDARLEGILLTHGHFDHTASVDKLRDAIPVPLMIHAEDAEMLTNGMINGYFDFFGRPQVFRPADKLLSDGDLIRLAGEEIRVLHTPGHSRGSCCFLAEGEDGDMILSGDTLFSDNIGRCDLYGGDELAIVKSLKAVSKLNRDAVIHPGHGGSARLGDALAAVADAFGIQDLI